MAGTPKSWRAKTLPRVIRVGGALGRPKAQRVSNFTATDNAWQQCVAEGGSSPSFAPSASLRRISSTVIRVPRITGFPIIIAGLISIRSVVITILLAHHIAPAPVGHENFSCVLRFSAETVPHGRTPTAGVLRRNGYQQPAPPRQFVLQLTAQFERAGVEHSTIQAGLPLDVLAVLFLAAPRCLRHVPDGQVLDEHHGGFCSGRSTT